MEDKIKEMSNFELIRLELAIKKEISLRRDETPLTEFLDCRIVNALYNANIKTLADLINTPDAKIMNIRTIGQKSFYQILKLKTEVINK